MGINIIDQSGQSRSDQDLQDAIDAVTREMVVLAPGNPQLIVMLPTIRECLVELQGFREIVKRIKAKQAEG